jgi:P450-derived glycosyltransferase activator
MSPIVADDARYGHCMAPTEGSAGLGDQVRFGYDLARRRGKTWVNGRLLGDPYDRLRLRAGQVDPYPMYEALRAAGQLRATRQGDLVVTSFDLCRTVLTDRNFGVRPADSPSPRAAGEPLDLSFLDRDPPEHTRLRRLASPAFTARAVTAYQPTIAEIAADLLHRPRAAGRFDLVSALAVPLPVAIISRLLGLQGADHSMLARHGAAVAAALDGVSSISHARRLLAAQAELDALFHRLIKLKLQQPSDDLLSNLVAELAHPAGPDDSTLSEDDLIAMCWLLLIAGFETTVNLISNAMLALLRHPQQWALLVADPGLAPKVVEETLRYDPPVQRTARIAHRQAWIGGRMIPEGTWLSLLIGAAQRDPQTCERPADFDITRADRIDHLAFSAGIHYCLGAPLARLEASTALSMIAETMPGLRLAGRVTYRRSSTIRGPLRLPVQV